MRFKLFPQMKLDIFSDSTDSQKSNSEAKTGPLKKPFPYKNQLKNFRGLEL